MNRTTKAVFMALSRAAMQAVHGTINYSGYTSNLPTEALEYLHAAVDHIGLAASLVNKTPITDFSGE